MAKLSSIRSDKSREESGVEVHFAMGIHILVAREGNPKYVTAVRELFKKLRSECKSTTLESERVEEGMKEIRANHIIKGWRNLTNDDGTEITFSPEKALEIFREEEFHDFYEFVIQASQNAANFRREQVEAELGNS